MAAIGGVFSKRFRKAPNATLLSRSQNPIALTSMAPMTL
jgi:hypothetical protein